MTPAPWITPVMPPAAFSSSISAPKAAASRTSTARYSTVPPAGADRVEVRPDLAVLEEPLVRGLDRGRLARRGCRFRSAALISAGGRRAQPCPRVLRPGTGELPTSTSLRLVARGEFERDLRRDAACSAGDRAPSNPGRVRPPASSFVERAGFDLPRHAAVAGAADLERPSGSPSSASSCSARCGAGVSRVDIHDAHGHLGPLVAEALGEPGDAAVPGEEIGRAGRRRSPSCRPSR